MTRTQLVRLVNQMARMMGTTPHDLLTDLDCTLEQLLAAAERSSNAVWIRWSSFDQESLRTPLREIIG
jgi:hypothetical protein